MSTPIAKRTLTGLRKDSAFEIVEHWKEEPPPRAILEDLTAKGSGVRGRTLDSFEKPGPRESEKLANGDNSDSENDGTPKREKMDLDEPETTGRSTRGTYTVQGLMFNVGRPSSVCC